MCHADKPHDGISVCPSVGSTFMNPINLSDDSTNDDVAIRCGSPDLGLSHADNDIKRVPSNNLYSVNQTIVTDDQEHPHPASRAHQKHYSHLDLPKHKPTVSMSFPPNYFTDQCTLTEWPIIINSLRQNINPCNVRFPDIDLGKCTCSTFCYKGVCLSTRSAVYCGPQNCSNGIACGNRLKDHESLALMQCSKGYGVITTAPIPTNTIIGEYKGTIVTASALTSEQISNESRCG